jgi:hypothetical protein
MQLSLRERLSSVLPTLTFGCVMAVVYEIIFRSWHLLNVTVLSIISFLSNTSWRNVDGFDRLIIIYGIGASLSLPLLAAFIAITHRKEKQKFSVFLRSLPFFIVGFMVTGIVWDYALLAYTLSGYTAL